MEHFLVDEDQEEVGEGGDGNDDGHDPGEGEEQAGGLLLLGESVALVKEVLVLRQDLGGCKKIVLSSTTISFGLPVIQRGTMRSILEML